MTGDYGGSYMHAAVPDTMTSVGEPGDEGQLSSVVDVTSTP
jgi:hypothetical protein